MGENKCANRLTSTTGYRQRVAQHTCGCGRAGLGNPISGRVACRGVTGRNDTRACQGSRDQLISRSPWFLSQKPCRSASAIFT
ncbi:hypothetical protein J6590_071325 [Homalodisca vitripennis]|nr:hypothetical protein J6590_071325 [Homalodisca vitripennis]